MGNIKNTCIIILAVFSSITSLYAKVGDERDSSQVITSVEISSSASPEGSLTRNRYITDMRVAGVASIIKNVSEIPDSAVTVRSVAENWEGLKKLVEASDMNHKEEVMAILKDRTISDDDQLRYTEMKVRMLLKTNGLSDLLATPNAGVEFHLGNRWSAGANLAYGWWTDRSKFFWRTFATDVNLRKYFGRMKSSHPLQGHHAGIYAGIVTYDYELGGRGFISDYKESWSHYSGLDYGYSFPLADRLDLDFTIGLGHVGGYYKEYLPDWDNNSQSMHYVWQSTKDRNFWGPTRLEISLVWLIGKNK